MCFLIESGNQVTESQVSLPASIQHVADRLSKHVAPIAVLQRIEKKKALCSHHGWLFWSAGCNIVRDQLQRSPNRFHARIRSFAASRPIDAANAGSAESGGSRSRNPEFCA